MSSIVLVLEEDPLNCDDDAPSVAVSYTTSKPSRVSQRLPLIRKLAPKLNFYDESEDNNKEDIGIEESGDDAGITTNQTNAQMECGGEFVRSSGFFSCPRCEKRFTLSNDLYAHLKFHEVEDERRVKCSICQKPFHNEATLKHHIEFVHETPRTTVAEIISSPTGQKSSHPLPSKWQADQPYPCKYCERVFKDPLQLEKHKKLHTNDMKPYKCPKCGQRFKSSNNCTRHVESHHKSSIITTAPRNGITSNHTFKCLVCGRKDFKTFLEFRSHRLTAHVYVPYDPEKEKPFACGVCMKPHHHKIGAIVCSLLGHDPIPLRREMFQHKCPECPPERFGYHNFTYLQRHWEAEHSDKHLPQYIVQGLLYDKENKILDSLPICTIDKNKEKLILKHPDEYYDNANLEFPLYTELGLPAPPPVPTTITSSKPKETKVMKKPEKTKIKKTGPKSYICVICEIQFSKGSYLRRHMQRFHKSSGRKMVAPRQCPVCNKSFWKTTAMVSHQQTAHRKKRKILMKKNNKRSKKLSGMTDTDTTELAGDKKHVGRPKKKPLQMSAQASANFIEPPQVVDAIGQGKSMIIIKEQSADYLTENNLFGAESATHDNDAIIIKKEIVTGDSQHFQCKFCPRSFTKQRALNVHQVCHSLLKPIKSGSGSKSKC